MSIDCIPVSELMEDLRESVTDIDICQVALAVGITHHRDGMPVQDRIEGNDRIIKIITAELQRRGCQQPRTASFAAPSAVRAEREGTKP